jgi:hypothetical protein
VAVSSRNSADDVAEAAITCYEAIYKSVVPISSGNKPLIRPPCRSRRSALSLSMVRNREHLACARGVYRPSVHHIPLTYPLLRVKIFQQEVRIQRSRLPIRSDVSIALHRKLCSSHIRCHPAFSIHPSHRWRWTLLQPRGCPDHLEDRICKRRS